jgi:hypothetical protein
MIHRRERGDTAIIEPIKTKQFGKKKILIPRSGLGDLFMPFEFIYLILSLGSLCVLCGEI